MRTRDDKLIFENYGKRLYFTQLHYDELYEYGKKWIIPRIKAFNKFHPLPSCGKGVMWWDLGKPMYGLITDEQVVVPLQTDLNTQKERRVTCFVIYTDTEENLLKFGTKVLNLPKVARDILDI